MFQIDTTRLRAFGLAAVLACSGSAVLLHPAPVAAQSAPQPRSLPDFTDLVEQVGPAVVNIRTLERARSSPQSQGQMDEDMQEFFRRFFGQPMPNVPRSPRAPNRPAPEQQE